MLLPVLYNTKESFAFLVLNTVTVMSEELLPDYFKSHVLNDRGF